MRILLPFLLGLPLFSMACLVQPAEPGPRDDGYGDRDRDGDASESSGSGEGRVDPDEGGQPARPTPAGFYAKALLASQFPPSSGGDGGGSSGGDASPDDPFSDPNRLLVVLSSEPFACSDPFGTSKCTTDRLSWSISFTLWPDQQRPGRYDLLEEVNGGFFETLPDPNLQCGAGGGSAQGVVVVDAIDARSVQFHFERTELFSPDVERTLLSSGPFVAARCP